jgi:hypothetical protein
MRAHVNKYLNARGTKPSTQSPCAKFLSPGDTFTVKEIVSGDVIEGNGIWYQAAEDGYFYWSGGTENDEDVFKGKAFSHEELIAFHKSAASALAAICARDITGFNGVSIGHKGRTKRLCLTVYIEPKKFHVMSPRVADKFIYRGLAFLVQKKSKGGVRLHAFFPDSGPDLPMGGSVSGVANPGDLETNIGSRSALVFRQTTPFLLCCYHVACSMRLVQNMTTVTQTDGVLANLPSKVSNSPMATLVPQPPVMEGSITNEYEYALIRVDDVTLFDNVIPGIGPFTSAYTADELTAKTFPGTPVQTLGATSAVVRTGKITQYYASSITVNYKGVPNAYSFSGVVEATNMSQEGDSGAPVVDNTGKLVGFIIAGDATTSYILPFVTFESFLGLSLTPSSPNPPT